MSPHGVDEHEIPGVCALPADYGKRSGYFIYSVGAAPRFVDTSLGEGDPLAPLQDSSLAKIFKLDIPGQTAYLAIGGGSASTSDTIAILRSVKIEKKGKSLLAASTSRKRKVGSENIPQLASEQADSRADLALHNEIKNRLEGYYGYFISHAKKTEAAPYVDALKECRDGAVESDLKALAAAALERFPDTQPADQSTAPARTSAKASAGGH